MVLDGREPMYFYCRSCERSLDDEESTWVVDVKWPAKLKVGQGGKLGYMLADMKDEDILERLDLSTVICDACKSTDVEVREWDTTPEWAVNAKKKETEPDEPTKD